MAGGAGNDGSGGVVHYSHQFKILRGKNAASAAMEIVGKQNGEEVPQKPANTTVSRTLEFSSTASLMYPSEVQSFELGVRPYWEYVDTTFVDFENSGLFKMGRVLCGSLLGQGSAISHTLAID